MARRLQPLGVMPGLALSVSSFKPGEYQGWRSGSPQVVPITLAPPYSGRQWLGAIPPSTSELQGH